MTYAHQDLTRAEVDTRKGALILQFGENWCGICRSAEPLIEEACASAPDIPRIKVQDGRGRPLGRSFRVKLWPTLIFLKDGQELARVVRPESGREVEDGMAVLR